MEARAETVAQVVAETGAVEIHPFDDPRVQAGQGTATLELLEAVPAIGMVVAPVSGGGLLSRHRHRRPRHRPVASPVWGAEPERRRRRLPLAGRRPPRARRRRRDTIADGLVAQLSERTLAILQAERVQVVTVTEDEIVEAHAAPGRRRQADRGAQRRRRPGRPGPPGARRACRSRATSA